IALGSVRHSPEDFLRFGSVNTNLAHAEAASGIAGLIKLALSLHHKYLPRSLHFKTPNPTIPWSELPVRVQSQAGEWPAPLHGECRIAGINNFGISGTNAHLVFQEAPQVLQEAPKVTDDVTLLHEVGARPEILALSAKSPEALVDLGRAYEQRFTSAGDGDVDRTPGATDTSAVVRAAALGRMHHELRAAIVARTRARCVDA